MIKVSNSFYFLKELILMFNFKIILGQKTHLVKYKLNVTFYSSFFFLQN